MDRGRKRAEAAEQLPADKRACGSSEFRASSSSSSAHARGPSDCDMAHSSSPAYGSCPSESDSDDDQDHDHGEYMDDERCSPTRAKFQRIAAGLEGAGDPSAQVAALAELCETLSFCVEDSLACFPVDAAVPALARLAGPGGDGAGPEAALLAVRAMTYLCDAMPRAADALVRHGAVPVLCARLLAIDYLDLAEQCLQALEKISRRQPVPCLQAGAIMAVLTFIDFFSTSIQRVALSTVANICKKLPLDCSSLLMESVPTLCNLLQYEDRKLVETVATCLIRITESFSHSSEPLDELCQQGLINQLVHLISVDCRMMLGQTTYIGLIGLLTKLAAGSLLAVKTLFELNISNSLRGILTASDFLHGPPYSLVGDAQSSQVLSFSLVRAVNSGTFILHESLDLSLILKTGSKSNNPMIYEVLKLLNQLIPPAASDVEDVQLALAKEKILTDQPKFLLQFSMDMLPVLIQVVNSGANLHVCYGCVSAINNIFYISKHDILLDLIKSTNISSFLAGLLARKDHHILVSTLKIVEILMQKLPGVFSSSFVKEGVTYAIDALLMLENCSQSMAQQSSVTQHSDNQVVSRDACRCLCYTFISQRSESSETKTCKLGKDAVLSLAKHIKATYFITESVNSEVGLTEILQKLKTFCAILNDNVGRSISNDCCAQNEDYLYNILDQVMRELSGGDTMSTFEFIESGIVRSLAYYLTNGKYLQENFSNCNSVNLNHFIAVLKRVQKFMHISLSKASKSCEDMLLTLLVRKLQNALSSFDNFPVILSHAFKPRNSYADVPVRRSTLCPCIKVRFVREEGEPNLCDYGAVLTIELSSSLEAIEKVLWPKVSRNKNDNLANQTGKDMIKSADIASGSKCGDELDTEETHATSTQQSQESFSTIQEGLMNQELQPLPVDSSTKPSDMISEMICALSSAGEGRVEGGITSASSSNEDARQKLVFFLEGKKLDRSITLYQAILQEHISVELDITVGPKFWNEVYIVTYKRAERSDSQNDSSYSSLWDKTGLSWQILSFLPSVLLAELPCKLDKSIPSYDILFLLKILEGLNRISFHLLAHERHNAFAEGRIHNLDDLKVIVSSVPQAEFISTKLTDKLEQQMRDPLVLTTGSIPSWCSQLMAVCPFLFSFEARWKYFHLTIFGPSRNQQNLMRYSHGADTESVVERRSQSVPVSRKKFKVNRGKILESAAKMMASHARSKAVIEVEYIEEVGTGLGPTMEFYTLVSHEFQKVGLGMWREDQGSFTAQLLLGTSKVVGDSGFVVAPFGLFPCPWSAVTSLSNGVEFPEVVKRFALLGQLVAKAIKDGRILDLPFSRAFYKLILEQELGIYDIQSFDPDLGRTLLEFQALVDRKKVLESASGEDFGVAPDLRFRNSRIEDLCLDFTLPGYTDYVLTSGSKSKMVYIANLEEYVSLVVDATVKSGISRQLEAFKSGFNEVFPLKSLQIFTEDELERVLCGERETWDFHELLDHIKFDHGYTSSSPPVINLLEIIQEFGSDQRRAFLQFVTGAPRLPTGGLAALNPKLTIVRKHCSSNTDMDLPSVMTCANYLKLPPYSSKELMRQRLIYAITEGQGSFHLS